MALGRGVAAAALGAALAAGSLAAAGCGAARRGVLGVADTITISDRPPRGRDAVLSYGDESGGWANDSLRRVLLALADQDRAVRRDFGPNTFADTALLRRMDAVDSANAVALLDIVRQFGWPGKSKVGALGASAAWLVAHHSPAKLGLLEQAHRLMSALPPGEVSPADLAMLTDRLLVTQKKPQRYGTQFTPFVNGTTTLSPVEDPAGLEGRRADAGLPPMREQIREIEFRYQVRVVPAPPSTPSTAPSPSSPPTHTSA